MTPKKSSRPPLPDSGPEFEARRAAILAENEAHDARIDEKPFDLEKELGVDWKSEEFRGYKPPKRR